MNWKSPSFLTHPVGGFSAARGLLGVRGHLSPCSGVSPSNHCGATRTCARSVAGANLCCSMQARGSGPGRDWVCAVAASPISSVCSGALCKRRSLLKPLQIAMKCMQWPKAEFLPSFLSVLLTIFSFSNSHTLFLDPKKIT